MKDQGTILNELWSSTPTDFSFRKISDLKKAQTVRPRSIRLGREVTRGPTDKIISDALWLNHNALSTFRGLTDFCECYFELPYKIKWIDLSFNEINQISEEILKFKELTILYLHGNCIDSMNELIKLRDMKSLRTLSLYGSPVETVPFYRQKVIYLLPQLKNLDFVTITPREAIAPTPPGAAELINH